MGTAAQSSALMGMPSSTFFVPEPGQARECPAPSQSLPTFKILLHLVVGGPRAGLHLPDSDSALAKEGALLLEREGKGKSLDKVLR